LCHQQGLEWLVKGAFFQPVMVLGKLSQPRTERSADSFVSELSELTLAPFDIVPYLESPKVEFIFIGQDLHGHDEHGWKIEITCEQFCSVCLLMAVTVYR
jgi:hypothetical protein